LAELYFDQGRLAEAEVQWKQALAERPEYPPAVRGLGECYLRHDRLAELDALIAGVGENGQGNLQTIVLKARRHLAVKEFGQAREVLEQALQQAPHEPYLWRLLSHALLQEGQDWDNAEKALCRVLELDPSCEEARNNLAVLRSQLAEC
jgi:Flp pilus assembly protein TadD